MRIKNWKKFQHFSNRRPPWIKLYREILDDIEWHELTGDAAKILVELWLIASEGVDGQLPPLKTLAFRLRVTEKKLNDSLSMLSHWVEQDDIAPISEQHQDVASERETEKEEERETEKECAGALVDGVQIPDDLLPSLPEITDWLDYKKRRGDRYKPGPGIEALWRAIRKIPPDRRRAAVDHSMSSTYKGIYEKNGGTNGTQRSAGYAEPRAGKYQD